MDSIGKLENYGIRFLCWAVKGVGLVLLGLVVLIAIGKGGPPNPFELSTRELLLFAALLITLTGIVLALWRQLIGGALMAAGMVPFYLTGINWRSGWVFHTFVLVSILNIICWWLKRRVSARKS